MRHGTPHVAGTLSMAGLDAVKVRDLLQVFFPFVAQEVQAFPEVGVGGS
jgi:hypothetical protein